MEKKKFKFNIVDAIVVLIIVAVIAIVGMKFYSGDVVTTETSKYKISFYCEEVPEFAAELVEEGNIVTDDNKNSALGVVEKVVVGPSDTYAATADGQIKRAPKEGYNSVLVESIVDAQEFEHGIMVNASKYGVGHSLTIRVGKAKLYGRVSGLEKVN